MKDASATPFHRTDFIFRASATTRLALDPSVVGNYLRLHWHIGAQSDVCLGSMAGANRGCWRTGIDGLTIRNRNDMYSPPSVIDSHDRRSDAIDFSDNCRDMGLAAVGPVSCARCPPLCKTLLGSSLVFGILSLWIMHARGVVAFAVDSSGAYSEWFSYAAPVFVSALLVVMCYPGIRRWLHRKQP